MIPKIIHYCWVGNAPKPKSVLYCIESWKKFCPDYEIREWNESNYDFTKNKYMKQAYEAKKWGFVPDYARLDIIYEYGGIYLDTDVEIIRSFDELLDQEAFMGFEETGEKTYYVNCGQGFGAVPHHEIIKKARDLYEHISFYKEDGTLNMLASPHYTTQILKEYGLLQENKDQNLRSMKIYASDVLCPKNFRTGKIHESNRTVSIHHFTASWLDEKIKKEIKRRQKLERVMGKGGTNKFLYIESVLQKYAGLKMFTKLPLRAKEKLKKRIIKIVEVVPDYKELILASFFKSDKKKIVLLDPSYDGDNTGDQIIVENCKKYFPLTKKENIIYVPTHRKLMNKEIRELSGATIKVLCGTNALSGHMRTYGLWRMEKKVRIYNNTILMGVGFECNNQEYDYYTKMLLHTISFLRDSLVDIDGHGKSRLGHTYAYGGVGLTINTINKTYDLDIQNYITISFDDLVNVIDEIGGVTVFISEEEAAYYRENGMPDIQAGDVTLTGSQALAHARNRTLGNDFERTRRQRSVMYGIYRKIMEKKDPSALLPLINYAVNHVKTNMSVSEMYSMAKDVLSVDDLKMQQTCIPQDGTYTDITYEGMQVLKVDFDANKKKIEQLLY